MRVHVRMPGAVKSLSGSIVLSKSVEMQAPGGVREDHERHEIHERRQEAGKQNDRKIADRKMWDRKM